MDRQQNELVYVVRASCRRLTDRQQNELVCVVRASCRRLMDRQQNELVYVVAKLFLTFAFYHCNPAIGCQTPNKRVYSVSEKYCRGLLLFGVVSVPNDCWCVDEQLRQWNFRLQNIKNCFINLSLFVDRFVITL